MAQGGVAGAIHRGADHPAWAGAGVLTLHGHTTVHDHEEEP